MKQYADENDYDYDYDYWNSPAGKLHIAYERSGLSKLKKHS